MADITLNEIRLRRSFDPGYRPGMAGSKALKPGEPFVNFSDATLSIGTLDGGYFDLGGGTDARAFGFVGDGDYHPLSERFATLTAAQAVYPRAEALSDQIDGLAVQKAIDAASSSGRGAAHVTLPAGQWYLTRRLVSDGNMHVAVRGAGIKATTAVVLGNSPFLDAGSGSPMLGTVQLDDMQIAAGADNPGTVALIVNSLAVPSMLGENVQFFGWKTVLNGMNITGSHCTKWRAYYGPGVQSEANRLTNAYVFRQTRGCFLNVFDTFQTEGYVNACDYLNTSNPGYEGQYWPNLNVNSGTSVATIASNVAGYDAPQWVFTDIEIEVSRQWFDLRNISSFTCEVDFALTSGAATGFSLFNMVDVVGAEITLRHFKSFSFPNYVFNLISGNTGINMTVGTLRVVGGKVSAGLVFFGAGNTRCIENGLVQLIGWDYTVPFAAGPAQRLGGNVSVHAVKYLAGVAGFKASVEPRGAETTVSLVGSKAGSTTNANGDFPLTWGNGIFSAAPIILPTAGDASVPIEPVGTVSATAAGGVVRCQGAGSGAARRINFLAVGS